MIFESCRSITDNHHCCLSRFRIRRKETSSFWLVVWSIFLGICNIVICGYIEIVEQQACHDNEFRLTCPMLDTHMAILEAVFTPANSTNLINPFNQSDLATEDDNYITCADSFFLISYPHTSAEKYRANRRMAENRSMEENIRAPVSRRCSGVNHCSFVLNLDHKESRSWGAGLVYIKYVCMDDSRVTKFCNTEVEVGEGFVHNPGYPHYYVGENICRWHLRAAKGQTVQLTLLDLSFRTVVEPFESQCVDKLIIQDGVSGQILLTSCEQVDEPIMFESEGSTMDVYIRTNSKKAYPKRGVLFQYKALGCITPPAPSGGYLAWRQGAEAYFMCCVGHTFPDGQRQRTLRCLRRNAWDKTLPDCVEQGVKIWDGNGTYVVNNTNNSVGNQHSNTMLVDVIIPSLIIAFLFLGNAVIVFIIFKYRKRKEETMGEDEEFTTLTREAVAKNGTVLQEQNHDNNVTNSV
ncbi:uncharacterized protein LOC143910971 [Arctopsyche grandis]|uniref:uncharacterized protein LOC143910971 n=1 Tax=Arctopsyche grandis TaxID=121162 RepID=UPI00406D7D75